MQLFTIKFYPVQFMIDTGAAFPLLDTNTWNKVKGTSILQPWVNPGLVVVSGMPLRVKGTVTLQLELRGHQY